MAFCYTVIYFCVWDFTRCFLCIVVSNIKSTILSIKQLLRRGKTCKKKKIKNFSGASQYCMQCTIMHTCKHSFSMLLYHLRGSFCHSGFVIGKD